jgi:hypothetical protein
LTCSKRCLSTEKEALANAHKEFAKTEAEKKRIYLRSQ